MDFSSLISQIVQAVESDETERLRIDMIRRNKAVDREIGLLRQRLEGCLKRRKRNFWIWIPREEFERRCDYNKIRPDTPWSRYTDLLQANGLNWTLSCGVLSIDF